MERGIRLKTRALSCFVAGMLLAAPAFQPTPALAREPEAAAVAPSSQGGLAVDEVSIGMTYDQVLALHGLPKAVGEKSGCTWLAFPAPPKRLEGATAWFFRDRVVYATGYGLTREGEPLFLFGMERQVLEEVMGGPPEPLQIFAQWWPDSGVVLAGANSLFSGEALRSPLGLRDRSYPLKWSTDREGKRFSTNEPWVDDERVVWLAEDVELGMPEERARQLAGDLDVVYQGGFVQAVRGARNVLLSRYLGDQDLSLEFEVGAAPGTLSEAVRWPHDGWYSPASGGRVKLRGGKVSEVELALSSKKLFQALEKYRGAHK